jgi:multiple sugar transport system permease protein
MESDSRRRWFIGAFAKRWHRLLFRGDVFAWAAMLPGVLTLALTGGYPLTYGAYLSFVKWRFLRSASIECYIGFENFRALLQDERYWGSMRRTALFLLGSVPAELLIGLGLALLLANELRGKKMVRSVLLMPMMIMPVVIAMIWKMMYDVNFGLLNGLLLRYNIVQSPIEWLSSPSMAMLSIIIATVWQWYPLTFLVSSASLESIPGEQYEAADVDGASSIAKFRHITLPHLIPSLMVVVLIRVMDGFRTFAIVYNLTGGGPGNSTELVSFYIYNVAFRNFNIGRGAAMSVTLMAIMVAISMVLFWYNQRVLGE